MARCCCNSPGTRGFKYACLNVIIQSCCRRSTRFAPLVSADLFFPFLKSCGKVLQLASELCAFLHSEDPDDGAIVSAPQNLMVLQRYRGFHFLVRPEVQHGLVHSFPEHRQLVLHPLDRTVDPVLRSWWSWQLFRFSSLKDPENTRGSYGELFPHVPQRVPICHQFPNTKQYRTVSGQYRCSISAANQLPPINLGLRTKALRYYVFVWHMNSVLEFVCHCATQLKLEGVESNKHHCGLSKTCLNMDIVHKEHATERESFHRESACRNCRTKWIPWAMLKNSMILKLRATLEYPTIPVNPWVFRVQEAWQAAILNCSLLHGTYWARQDTFLKVHLLEVNHPQHSRI